MVSNAGPRSSLVSLVNKPTCIITPANASQTPWHQRVSPEAIELISFIWNMNTGRIGLEVPDTESLGTRLRLTTKIFSNGISNIITRKKGKICCMPASSNHFTTIQRQYLFFTSSKENKNFYVLRVLEKAETGSQIAIEWRMGHWDDPWRDNKYSPGVGVLRQFSLFRYFFIYLNYQNFCYLLDITYIFDRCHHSWAVVTHVQYERDTKDLIRTFAKSQLS